MRSVFNYKTKEEFASEKAEFESYLYYLKQTDPRTMKNGLTKRYINFLLKVE